MKVKCSECGNSFEHPLNTNCPKCGSLYNPSGSAARNGTANRKSSFSSTSLFDDADEAKRPSLSSSSSTKRVDPASRKWGKGASLALTAIPVILVLISVSGAVIDLFINSTADYKDSFSVSSATPKAAISNAEDYYSEYINNYWDFSKGEEIYLANFGLTIGDYTESEAREFFDGVEFNSINIDDYKMVAVPYTTRTYENYDDFMDANYNGRDDVYYVYSDALMLENQGNLYECFEIGDETTLYGNISQEDMTAIGETLMVKEYYSNGISSGCFYNSGDINIGEMYYMVPKDYNVSSISVFQYFVEGYTDSEFDITQYYMEY